MENLNLSEIAKNILIGLNDEQFLSELMNRYSIPLERNLVELEKLEKFVLDNEAVLRNLKPLPELMANQKFNLHRLIYSIEPDTFNIKCFRIVYYGEIIRDGAVTDTIVPQHGWRIVNESKKRYSLPYIYCCWELDGTVIGQRDPNIFNLKID